jgi:hypothetical protein
MTQSTGYALTGPMNADGTYATWGLPNRPQSDAPRFVEAPELMERLRDLEADDAARDAHDSAVRALMDALHTESDQARAMYLRHAWSALDGYASV